MKDDANLLDIIQTALGTFEHRQPYSPGMFDPLTPLFKQLGYESAAIYIADDYPDRLSLVAGYGGEKWYPPHVVKNRRRSLYDETVASIRQVPGLMVRPLFNHDRELGAVAVTTANPKDPTVQRQFDTLARSLSLMAYIERIRTNGVREREERDIFFAQSLTNRLLVRQAPKHRELRLGFEFHRSLEAGGDFFEFLPEPDGNLIGYIGCCSGKGLRTVLEVTSIMREVNQACHGSVNLTDALRRVNSFLVKEAHRAHQASLAVFRINVRAHKLQLAKAGRLGLLICGPTGTIDNISSSGSMFLGMVDKPEFTVEEYDFVPEQALFCVTEGFYSSSNVMGARPQLHWFLDALAAVMERKRKLPLANAIFDSVNRKHDHSIRPDESMLAVSVEFTGRQASVRIRQSERHRQTERYRR
ncbi:MAG: SpoIIE family protein phosphatase [Planctomycetaceae bacterium]|nr:SpoIIE family protein phosphatase [Planctomycetaceae bacterium]